MDSKRINTWKNLDWWILVIYAILVFMGWCCVYSAGYNFDDASIFDFEQRFGKQLVWIGLSFLLGLVILLIDRDFYEYFSYLIYVLVIILLIATIFLARDIKGSRSWLELGPLTIQPAEFSKFATALALATFMNTYNFKLLTTKNICISGLLIFLPMFLILLQKETGSALVYVAFFLVLYREGLSGMILFAGFSAIVIFILSIKFGEVMIGEMTSMGEFLVVIFVILSSFMMLLLYQPKQYKVRRVVVYILLASLAVGFLLWFLQVRINLAYVGYACIAVCSLYLFFRLYYDKIRDYLMVGLFSVASIGFMFSVNYLFDNVLQPHQQIRIKVLLGIEEDLTGAGYNVNQSKIAIGSGGLLGKGFLNGTQTKLKYVPEQDTDFIFCTVGEEYGFIGSALVLLLFVVLLLRILTLAERQRTTIGRVYGYSVASILLFHLIINVGMVIGLSPVIGIPLPLFSYGGSSLWSFTILLFIFLRIAAGDKEK